MDDLFNVDCNLLAEVGKLHGAFRPTVVDRYGSVDKRVYKTVDKNLSLRRTPRTPATRNPRNAGLVPKVGLEPARSVKLHWILSPSPSVIPLGETPIFA